MSRVILVTGGAGYIGSQLIRDLATDPNTTDCTIRILDNLRRETYGSLLDLPESRRYEFIEGDLLDNTGMRRALDGVWAVVHMAAIVRTPLSFGGSAGHIEQVNHWGTANLVEAATQAGVSLLVYTSSAAVYGPIDARGGQPFTERDICRPMGLYAESKLRGEKHVIQADERGLLQTVNLRLGPVFGYAPAVRFDGVANRFAYLAGIRRPLTVYGTGDQARPHLHVRDASSAIRFVLAQPDQTAGETFNVVGENASVLDVATAVQKLWPDANVRYTEQDMLTHLSYAIDGSKLHALGWYPSIGIEAGIAELLEHLRAFRVFRPGDGPSWDA